ncbi:MAG: protein-disulfide reductase DsbD family protein [Bdellovibrionales bacterium]|nr:protein-disulfide reductase DsbD family protein [Bdellovibrionales bacterium]
MNKILILFFAFHAFQVQAGEEQQASQAQLISPLQRVQADSFIDIGVYITLQKGWHTYWQNPGDIGQSLQWNHPSSISMSSLIWPIPQRMATQQWTNFIYKNKLLVKRKLYVPKDVQDTFSISSKITWLICKTSCVPMSQNVQLNLSIGEPLKDPSSHKIFQGFTYPESLDLTGTIERQKKRDILSIQSQKAFQLIDFFPINNLSNQPPVIEQSGPSSYVLSLPKSKKLYNNKALIVLKRDHKIQAEEIHLSPQSNYSLLLILTMAFIGGLILNFMPCVLPVVFLKFYHTASIPRSKLIASSLSYGAGIILSFISLAFLIQLLKRGGQAVGWGFQMESPLFVSLLILLFTLISFSFLDLFSIPVFLKKSKTKDNIIGSFLSGLLITATASPCTAPFMGTAVGYAFSRSLLEILFVFSSLGLGMASPYLLLCFFPKLLKYFPHPGSWNQKLKYAMSIPMLAASVWLLSILYYLIEPHLVISFVIALTLLALALWLKKNQYLKQWVFIGLLLTSALLVLRMHTSFYLKNLKQKSLQAGKTFSIEKLNQIRKQNPVLLYFTAPWCLSCQVNEWTTLKDKEVLEFLNQNNIVLMKINWSPDNADMSQIFEKHKRAGIPFTLFFPLEEKPEVILPEVLTPQILMNTIKKYIDL